MFIEQYFYELTKTKTNEQLGLGECACLCVCMCAKLNLKGGKHSMKHLSIL